MVLYFIYLLPSVGFEFSACCGSLTITFNKYISLLYVKRLFCNAEFFYIGFVYYFFKTQKQ